MRWFLLLITSASAVWAQQFTNGPWTYTLNGSNEATIISYGGSGGAVTVPTTLAGSSVKQIGGSWPPVFGLENAPQITSLVIPSGVTSIGDTAFYGCTWLTTLALPNGITNIGSGAFRLCTNLTSISLPDSVTRIGPGAFASTGLTSFSFPSGITSIENGTLDGALNLRGVVIPNGVTNIDAMAFNSTGLTNVTIPKSVTQLRPQAFTAGQLRTVVFEAGATTTGVGAFAYTRNLSSVSLPASMRDIGENSFNGCTALLQIAIPNGVTNIGYGAFESSGLQSVSVPESVTSVGDNAFNDCANMTNAALPSRFIASVARIGFSGELATDLMVKGIAERIVAALPQNYGIATKANVAAIPAGPQGPKGDTGAQGPQGLTGSTGPQGPPGGLTDFSGPDVDSSAFISGLIGEILTAPNNYGLATKFDLTKLPQTITFTLRSPTTVGQTISLRASTRSRLPITITSSDPNIVRVDGMTATALGKGTITLTATQEGNSDYLPAKPVSQTLTVN